MVGPTKTVCSENAVTPWSPMYWGWWGIKTCETINPYTLQGVLMGKNHNGHSENMQT